MGRLENMKKVECKCGDCRAYFIIDVSDKRGFPPWKIKCPLCESTQVEYKWIDKNGEG
jgi:Zn finger protein HypA/HybF involved in hydrogenase expression